MPLACRKISSSTTESSAQVEAALHAGPHASVWFPPPHAWLLRIPLFQPIPSPLQAPHAGQPMGLSSPGSLACPLPALTLPGWVACEVASPVCMLLTLLQEGRLTLARTPWNSWKHEAEGSEWSSWGVLSSCQSSDRTQVLLRSSLHRPASSSSSTELYRTCQHSHPAEHGTTPTGLPPPPPRMHTRQCSLKTCWSADLPPSQRGRFRRHLSWPQALISISKSEAHDRLAGLRAPLRQAFISRRPSPPALPRAALAAGTQNRGALPSCR